ncbi:MAG: gliding motility-associated lipoprotein GldH [Algoriphagus sp.]|jgi:gliding motility-associated lipoprotein GldH
MKRASLAVICSVLMSACTSDSVHKDLVDFDAYEWAATDVKSFDFEIDDNSKTFQVNYLLRNALQYPYYNIYLKSALKDSAGNVLMQGMEELILFDEKTGKPKGDGLGDLFDHRIGAAQYKDLKFPYPGNYSLELQQSMRPDPLVGIMSIGFEILNPKK